MAQFVSGVLDLAQQKEVISTVSYPMLLILGSTRPSMQILICLIVLIYLTSSVLSRVVLYPYIPLFHSMFRAHTVAISASGSSTVGYTH